MIRLAGILFILYFGCKLDSYAQNKYDYNWVFGYGAGILPNDTTFFGGNIVSFNNDRINHLAQIRNFEIWDNSNCFSDKFGNIKLISNNCLISNGQGTILTNGDSIDIGYSWPPCPNHSSSKQCGIFIPENDSIISYIYTNRDLIGGKYLCFGVLQALINQNSEIVLFKESKIIVDTLVSFGLTAIPKFNNSGYWIIQPKLYSGGIYVLNYENSIIKSKLLHWVGYPITRLDDGTGQVTFSPDGKLIAMYVPGIGLQLFDFDRSSGVISNARYLGLKYNQSAFGGCCFSPDSRFIYINTPLEVLQVDLREIDITKMVDTVGVFDNFFDPYPATYLQMALGPDCRIYIAAGGGNRYLHVITYPNRKGKACGLVNHGLKLLSRNAFAIPNNPHYRVDDPYPCDSTIKINLSVDNVDQAIHHQIEDAFFLYPNPVFKELFIDPIKPNYNPCTIQIYDLNGHQINKLELDVFSEKISILLAEINTGIYFIKIIDAKGNSWTEKFLKI